MSRVLLLLVSITGLTFTAYIDKPENYAHDALLPTTSAAAETSTTGADVVGPPEAPQATPTTSITATTTTHVTAVPSTSTTVAPAGAKCPELWGFAATYFDPHELWVVDAIAWAESRCQHHAVSSTNDYGVMQINWTVWGDTINSQGYSRDDLLNPAVNMLWAFLIAHEAERLGWCTWQPWYMSGDWC